MDMNTRLYQNREVSQILRLTPRQVISWTEKGLVEPKKPAKKAGTSRGYNYENLVELCLAKHLTDVVGLQFHHIWVILKELREEGMLNEIVADEKADGSLLYIFPNEEKSCDRGYVVETKGMKSTFLKLLAEKDTLGIEESRGFIFINLGLIKNEVNIGLSKI